MRISTANTYDAGVDALTRRQAELSETQARMTSLKRVNKASDDPAAAARAERALASIVRSQTNQRAVDASQSAMTQVEGAIGDATALLQQVRETLVAAGNASYTPADRLTLSDKLSALREQLFFVANRGDSASGFLFAGQGSTLAPFVDAPGGVQYLGTQGEAQTEQTTALPLSADGGAVWMAARTGNGVFKTSALTNATSNDMPRNVYIDGGQVVDPSAYYAVPPSTYNISFNTAVVPTTYAINRTPNPPAAPVTVLAQSGPYVPGLAMMVDGMSFTVNGTPQPGDEFQVEPSTSDLDVFSVLDKAIVDLKATSRSGTQIAQFNGDNLRALDSVLGNMLSARSAAGEVLNRGDSETERLASQKLSAQTARSNAEDLDMVEAISEFQNRQTSYDAALKSYSMVQRMSLFQYING